MFGLRHSGDCFARFLRHFACQALTFAIRFFELAREIIGFAGILRHKNIIRHQRVFEPSRRVETRTERKADTAGVNRVRLDAGITNHRLDTWSFG